MSLARPGGLAACLTLDALGPVHSPEWGLKPPQNLGLRVVAAAVAGYKAI